jgi:hypothetical protein
VLVSFPPARTNPVVFKVLPQKKSGEILGAHYASLRNPFHHDGFDSTADTIYAARRRLREGITFPGT